MRISILSVVVVISLLGCNKDEKIQETIAPEDLTAAVVMDARLSDMSTALNNLITAPNSSQRLYWDSAYHHHDSLFWHHHNIYHHNSYAHDDHGHQWVPYDPSINHHGHYHPPYPGHMNDSLIVTTNNHHHTNCDHHPGHHICHHHTHNQLHHLHHQHHH